MQLISTSNIGIRFLLSVVNIFSKYASVIRLPEKKIDSQELTLFNIF